MQPGKKRSTIGCLMINDLTSEERQLSGLSVFLNKRGIYARHFAWEQNNKLHLQLQTAFQKIRDQSQYTYIIGFESGCWGALALAAQLPVEKMILINAGKKGGEDPAAARQINRISAFARKNLSFCIGETLMIVSEDWKCTKTAEMIAGDLCNSRVRMMRIHVGFEKELCTNYESEIKALLYAYLTGSDLIKSLAEKTEMCIIYE